MMRAVSSVLSMIVCSFLRILFSLIRRVLRFLSLLVVRCSFSASSVRFMYKALSCLLRWRARVVFPTQGVPVTRMTRLFIVVNSVGGNFYLFRKGAISSLLCI